VAGGTEETGGTEKTGRIDEAGYTVGSRDKLDKAEGIISTTIYYG
jgi:hypothetical protein